MKKSKVADALANLTRRVEKLEEPKKTTRRVEKLEEPKKTTRRNPEPSRLEVRRMRTERRAC